MKLYDSLLSFYRVHLYITLLYSIMRVHNIRFNSFNNRCLLIPSYTYLLLLTMQTFL